MTPEELDRKERMQQAVQAALESTKTRRLEDNEWYWERMNPEEAESVAQVAVNALLALEDKR